MPGIARDNVVTPDGSKVPDDVICGQCQNVMVQPVANTCPHLFCFGCVRKKLASSQSARKCPTCGVDWDAEPKPIPGEVAKIMEQLKYYCPLHCGGVFNVTEKETHVHQHCPNFVLNCPNQKEGCRSKIERKKMESHLQGCHYRQVECEACGFKCLYVSLFAHQVVKKCMRQFLQKEYVNCLKSTHNSLINYSREMTKDRIKLQQTKHSLEMSYKNLEPLRYRRLYSIYGTPSAKHGDLFEELMSRPSTRMSFSRLGTSPSQDYLRNCRRCQSSFKPSRNHDKACMYHREVFLDLFVDDCGACGEEKESSTPCLRGFHINPHPAITRPLSSSKTRGLKLPNKESTQNQSHLIQRPHTARVA